MAEEKALVELRWYNVRNATVQKIGTGFIHKKDQYGIHILSVGEFIPELQIVKKSDIGVKVIFFDRKTQMDARVLRYDLTINLAAIYIPHCKEFNNYPLSCVEAAFLSTDPTFQGQSIKCIYHAHVFDICTGAPSSLFNQLTKGFIADGSYLDKGLVHFSMPLIFRGSLGAPVFDKHSNNVVSMITGWETGQGKLDFDKPFVPKLWNLENRYLGLPVPKIQQFLDQLPTDVLANSPI